MHYTEKTNSYNDRRYGKPWMAIVTVSLTRGFQFVDWDGQAGSEGKFSFDAEPGTLLAYGQKDLRKGRGGVDGYQICLPDGTLPTCRESLALDLRELKPAERWREFARQQLEWAVNRPTNSFDVPRWEKDCNQIAERYSAMLGVPNPFMVQAAEFFGLTEKKPEPTAASSVDMGAFGF